MKHHTPSPSPRTTEPKQDFPTSMLKAPGSDTATIHSADWPDESKFGKAEWRNLNDGFLYRHAVAAHPGGKTHKGWIPARYDESQKGEDGKLLLIHSGLVWEGSEAEWHENFRKE